MIEAIVYIITKIFEYFFSQNAPMTIAFIGLGGGVIVYMKTRENQIIAPLEILRYKDELMKKQMDMAEKYLDQLHAKLYGLYRHERRVYFEAEGLSRDEARSKLDIDMETFMHSLQLWGVHGAIRSEVRAFFRDNHLAEQTEEQFRTYLKKRTETVWHSMVLAISEYWFGGMTQPSRSDIYDVHEKNRSDILELVQKIFIDGRDIAIEAYRQIPEGAKKSWKKIKLFF